jgi:nucleoside 2-deoxyribosyltransferase
MKKKYKVYIASPYTIGDKEKNVDIQLKTASELLDKGFIPFAPLLSHFIHLKYPRTYHEWLKYDFEWLKECDFLLRLPGISQGADMEVVVAIAHMIPVFESIKELEEHIRWQNL